MCLWNARRLFLAVPSNQTPFTVRSLIAFVGTRTRRPIRTEGIVPSLTCFLTVASLTPSKNAACSRPTARDLGSLLESLTGPATTAGGTSGTGCDLISSCADRSNSLRNSAANSFDWYFPISYAELNFNTEHCNASPASFSRWRNTSMADGSACEEKEVNSLCLYFKYGSENKNDSVRIQFINSSNAMIPTCPRSQPVSLENSDGSQHETRKIVHPQNRIAITVYVD
jgi:hypothetical protein